MSSFVATVTLFGLLLYIPLLAYYRLYLHPIAKFPGPKLAAFTRYYEAYYDVFRGGQYTFKIAEMHRKYGPIIRISPHELHISDPAFYKQLYSHNARWDKYDWAVEAFGAPTATLHTVDFYQHKRRRAALNPFFSKANVIHKYHVIETMVNKFCHRLRTQPKGTVINLGNAISALTRDIATEILIGGSFNHLDVEDFHADLATLQQNAGEVWRTTKHIRWFGLLTQSIPRSIIDKFGDKGLKNFLSYLDAMANITANILSQTESVDANIPLVKGDTAHTIVHQILASDLPPSEKTLDHLAHEVITLTSAGMETTAYSLRVTIYHLFKNPNILGRLREELASSNIELSDAEIGSTGLAALEALPYLNAVLMEGLRLGTVVASRLQRVAPDRDLQYGQWRIPAGTPVGMTPLLMHQDETLFPEPKVFRPERWLNGDGDLVRIDQGFEPFSRGTRICLGMHLAWAELYTVIAKLLWCFDLSLDDVGPLDVEAASDKFVTATARQNGFKALVNPRI